MSEADRSAAVEALERLGLSNYEARVFFALQRLGDATAKEIHDEAGVPRSQVYGAAEELVERGIAEVRQSTPKRYRAVSLDAARERLTARLEHARDEAFEHLERARRQQRERETREDVWTVEGVAPVGERVVELAERAESRLVYGAGEPHLVTDSIVSVLRRRAEAGVDVVVVSENPAVRDRFADHPATVVATAETATAFSGRVLLADDDVVLLSVETEAGETAIWSAETEFARVLVRTVQSAIELFSP